EDEVLAVVNESERERDVELPRRARVEVVDGRATVLDVEREHFAHERGLTYEVALRVNADDARCAATLQLDCVEARVATDIEHAPAREVFGQADAHLLPGRSRVLDRLADGALGLGHNPAAQVNAVEPRAELVNAGQDFLSRHHDSALVLADTELERERRRAALREPADVLRDHVELERVEPPRSRRSQLELKA